MNLPWLPAVQTGICVDCGRVLRERKRKPCPECGCMSRIISRMVTERLVSKDRAS